MEHGLFKPKDFTEGQHAVVGDCNGIPMETRWREETPVFAKEILSFAKNDIEILDYGCGVGRLAKEILKQNQAVYVTGTDASSEMLAEAEKYVNHNHFTAVKPYEIKNRYDIIYCVYVLQHVPAIEIREILSRIHYHLKDNGFFIYCSSDYRMSIRHDSPGFFDDRFLGVNLREEISRYFVEYRPLFDINILENNKIIKEMVQGGLPHPAIVYKKKALNDYLHIGPVNSNYQEKPQQQKPQVEAAQIKINDNKEKVLLVNRLAPGDILVMTNAIRDLHKAYPDRFLTDVRTPCNEIFTNNPYITNLGVPFEQIDKLVAQFSKLDGINEPAKHTGQIGDVKVIDMHYPMIHTSGACGWHFSYGHRDWLEKILGVKIPQTDIRPEIYLDQNERDWASPVTIKKGLISPYWVINAGSKGDFTLKQYPYYQEVADILSKKINLVQIGQREHNHEPLDNVTDMVGETNIRELIRLIYHAEGVITCVSLPMHIAAAFNKPCVVIAGAREGTRWELYPNHQFLYVNGCLPCATYDGCWKSKHKDCKNKVEDIPRCMTLIHPEDVVRAADRYYEGGIRHYEPIDSELEGVLL